MPVRIPSLGRIGREGVAFAALLWLALWPLPAVSFAAVLPAEATSAASGSPPPLRLPFDRLEIQPIDGSSGLGPVSPTTIHFVDDRHVLVTYAVRRLMKRIPDDPADDEDHTVAAALVDLDSGKVMARAEWRFHDYQRYLWPLGHGRFLLRQRMSFTTFAPLAHLAAGKSFEETPFLHFDRRVVAVLPTPEEDFLTIETAPTPAAAPKPKKRSPMADFNAAIAPPSNAGPGATADAGPSAGAHADGPTLHRGSDESDNDQGDAPKQRIQILFFRILYPASDAEPVVARVVGHAVSNSPVVVPVNSNGYISNAPESKDGRSNGWEMDYNTFSGKTYQLPLYDSTCQPNGTMVSRGEIVVFGCQGKEQRRYFAAFNLLGEEMWQKGLYDSAPFPVLGFASGSGRLAVNRLIIGNASSDEGMQQLAHDRATDQTVDVYQINSGRQLIHVRLSPIETASQNFSLSPDGMGLAVVNNHAIEVYELPAPSQKEQSDAQKLLAALPPDADVPVQLGAPLAQEEPAESAASEPAVPEPPKPPQPTMLGDAPPEAHRKPPTLYNEPNDNVPGGDMGDGSSRGSDPR